MKSLPIWSTSSVWELFLKIFVSDYKLLSLTILLGFYQSRNINQIEFWGLDQGETISGTLGITWEPSYRAEKFLSQIRDLNNSRTSSNAKPWSQPKRIPVDPNSTTEPKFSRFSIHKKESAKKSSLASIQSWFNRRLKKPWKLIILFAQFS